MGELTEVETVVLRYVRGRVARREIQHNTAGRVRSILMGFAAVYGKRPLKLIGRKHIELWLEDRQDLSPASRRNEFQAVRQFLNWCVEERLIRVNPMAAMKAPKVPRSVPRAMPERDVMYLLDALPDARARAVVALMLRMGLRRGEVVALQTGDWDEQAETLTVVGKGGHTRVLPVPRDVAYDLRTYLAEHGSTAGYLIRREDGRGGISNSRIGQLIRAWMEHAGVKSRAGDGRAAHSLRHTMATNVVAHEPDLRVVQQILGHQSLTSTQVYLKHAELPRLRAAMERSA
jgi:site-specific recombinase XerD